ncbi:MAG: ROK family transcriptional regulator [Butyricicoccaceae bacterium]
MMTKSGASNRDVKKINRIRTMRSIFDCDRISQPELAAKVGNSWPTVLQNVKELMEMGLVQEVGTFESTGGRKAKAFAPVRNARYAVGLEITQNHIGAVLADLSGELVRFERKKRPFERSDTYAAMLAELVQSLLAKEDCPPEKVLGVGISLPGILDRDEQTLVYSHALGLRNVPVEEFSRHIPFPCRFINDANAAGLAEFRGQQSPRSVVYLSLSNSVGGSIFTGGSLYGGEHLRAGEFGHMTLVPDGRPCYCGKRGCLDAYCSAKVLSDRTDGNLALFSTVCAPEIPICRPHGTNISRISRSR